MTKETKITASRNFGLEAQLNLVGAKSLKDADGKELVVTGYAFAVSKEANEETGEIEELAVLYLLTNDGMYSTISPTAMQTVQQFGDIEEATLTSGKIAVTPVKRKGGKGDFIVLTVALK